MHFYFSQSDLPVERRISTEQQLLTCLTSCIECAADLRSSKWSISQKATILASKWNPLCRALVDNVHADLSKPIHVGLPRPVVTTLHCIVEKPVHRVAVVLVILGGIDATLRGDWVGTTRAILIAEAFHVVSQFSQCSGRGGTGQATAHHDDFKFTLVGWGDQFQVKPMFVPLFGYWAGWNIGLQNKRFFNSRRYFHRVGRIAWGFIYRSLTFRLGYFFLCDHFMG